MGNFWWPRFARLQADKSPYPYVPGSTSLWEAAARRGRGERQQIERDQAAEARRKDRERHRWPGDDASFEAAWPGILRARRQRRD